MESWPFPDWAGTAASGTKKEREREDIHSTNYRIIGLIIFILAQENDKFPLWWAVIMNRMSER